MMRHTPMPDLYIGGTLLRVETVRTLMRESIDGDDFAGKVAAKCPAFARGDVATAIRWFWRFS